MCVFFFLLDIRTGVRGWNRKKNSEFINKEDFWHNQRKTKQSE